MSAEQTPEFNFEKFVPIASGIVNFAKKLREVDVSSLIEKERTDYYSLVKRYEGLSARLLKYINDQKPVYKILLDRLRAKNSSGCERLFEKIDFETPISVLDAIMELDRDARDFEQTLSSGVAKAFRELIINGSAALLIGVLGATILCLTIISGGTIWIVVGSVVAFLSSTFSLGIGIDTWSSYHSYKGLKDIHEKVVEIKSHLKKITEQNCKLNQTLTEFKLKIEMGDSEFEQTVSSVYDELIALEKVILKD